MRARTFMQVSIGILALAAAYHLGANSARAQVVSGNPVVGIADTPGLSQFNVTVVSANGDVYGAHQPEGPWQPIANVFAGGATPVHATSFGELKVRYR